MAQGQAGKEVKVICMIHRTYDSWKADDYNPNMPEEVFGPIAEPEDEPEENNVPLRSQGAGEISLALPFSLDFKVQH